MNDAVPSQPAISDYAYVGDCHSAALISRDGSIDWCCMPRVDSASFFSRILDWEKGGYCQIAPTQPYQTSRNYLDNTMILLTCFQTAEATARIYDFFPMRRGGKHNPYVQIIRIIEGVSGSMEFEANILPRFDYGTIRPWIRHYKKTAFVALGGSYGLLITGDVPLTLKNRHQLTGTVTVTPDTRKYLAILCRRSEILDENEVEVPSVDELDCRLEETKQWWYEWVSQGKIVTPYKDQILRSALVLKSLINAPTGAMTAAATTSLPEAHGGCRNWDYRYSWIRDSYYSVTALAGLGFVHEANGFRRFIERSCQSSVEGLQVMFGLSGERNLREYLVSELKGYRGAWPVRIGNAAEKQLQLDMYGELVELAWNWHKRGFSPDNDYWTFLLQVIEHVCSVWQEPDQGIWEMRCEPRHFVHSKVMCWVALDRGIKLATSLGHTINLSKWQDTRDLIAQTVLEKGYDAERGVFVQAFDYPVMDSILLTLPILGFIPYHDERMIRTIAAIRQDLEEGGLLRRYAAQTDGMKGEEGVFLACSALLVICLSHLGQLKEAHEVFQRLLATGNDLYLFSEEYDPTRGEMLGNFPQALTHLSLIAAAIAIHRAEKKLNMPLLAPG